VIEILRSPLNRVALDEARHLVRFVSGHKPDQSAFVRHFDEFTSQRALYNLEQVLSKLCAGNLHDRMVPLARTPCALLAYVKSSVCASTNMEGNFRMRTGSPSWMLTEPS